MGSAVAVFRYRYSSAAIDPGVRCDRTNHVVVTKMIHLKCLNIFCTTCSNQVHISGAWTRVAVFDIHRAMHLQVNSWSVFTHVMGCHHCALAYTSTWYYGFELV